MTANDIYILIKYEWNKSISYISHECIIFFNWFEKENVTFFFIAAEWRSSYDLENNFHPFFLSVSIITICVYKSLGITIFEIQPFRNLNRVNRVKGIQILRSKLETTKKPQICFFQIRTQFFHNENLIIGK